MHDVGTGVSAVMISPEFRGTAFEARLRTLDGGVVTLPDGTRAGKLGYLNRLFGEHLTPNVVMDYVMEAIVATSPWLGLPGAGFTRVPSALCAAVPSEVVQSGYAELRAWLGGASDRIRMAFGPLITVPTFRVGLLSAGPLWEWAMFLSRHVFKVRCDTIVSTPEAFIFDYRTTAATEFEKLVTYYMTKDSAGWNPRLQGGA